MYYFLGNKETHQNFFRFLKLSEIVLNNSAFFCSLDSKFYYGKHGHIMHTAGPYLTWLNSTLSRCSLILPKKINILKVRNMSHLCSEEIASNKFFKDVRSKMRVLVFKIQKDFCEAIQHLEECKNFNMNKWNRPEGGTGIIQCLEDGEVFEKVSVCASEVHGNLPTPAFVLLKGENVDENANIKATFFTAGVSGVVYAKNPNIPTLHFSYKYFEMTENGETIWWFGGGTDLAPYILNIEDCQHFHRTLKKVCDKYDKSFYNNFKRNCDDYFFLKHRGERRGIGGIFFNDLNSPDEDTCFQFVFSCMHNIIPSYIPIIKKNKDMKYTFQDKQWQLLQRGRSVEFSLICDKAMKIALMTPGVQHESISVFLPPLAKWQYEYSPGVDSEELELLKVLRSPREWV